VKPASAALAGRLLNASFALTVIAAVVWVSLAREGAWWVAWLAVGALAASLAIAWATQRGAASQLEAAHRELGDRELQLGDLRARIDQHTSAQGRFVGNIAHELKTPLTIVLSQVDLLLAPEADPATMRRYAKSIRGDMHHLSDLIDGFLRLARPFAQFDASSHVPVFVHDFVVAAVSRSQSKARDNEVRIVTTLAETSAPDEPPEVMGESILLEAMIENLVRNAVRFSPRGGQVEVEVTCHAASINLHVRDHGVGIAAENLASVFDWFFDRPAQRRSTGTGFELAIVKRVAEHHGGTIELRNRPGGGCEFEITLPRVRPGDMGDTRVLAHG
jgi:signal transduction histidine kinase